MNKLHIFLLPIAIGSFGLLWTPLSENSAISYSLIAFAIIVGIIGLYSIGKQRELEQASQQEMLKVLVKILQSSNEEIVNKLQKQIESFDESTGKVSQEINQVSNVMISQMEKMESNLIVNMSKEQAKIVQGYALIEEKIDEGNKILENVSILMIQELKMIVQLTDELVALQNTMPNELSMLQDLISSNHQDTFDSSRNLEMHLEKLVDLQENVQAQYAESFNQYENIQSKITDEFANLLGNLDATTTALINQFTDTNNRSEEQLNRVSMLLGSLEDQQVVFNNKTEQSTEIMNGQLKELSKFTQSLVAGISQIADSKSAERQQLLKIQKDLITKFQED